MIEPVFGRLTGAAVLQIAYPAHDEARQLRFVLLASLDLNRLMKEQIQNLPPGSSFCWSIARAPCWTGHRRSIGPRTARHFDRGFCPVPACAGKPAATRELVGGDGERSGRPPIRSPSAGVALHVLVGRSKSELVAAPKRRLAEDMGALGILSIVLFAGVGLFAEFGIRSQIGRIAKMAGASAPAISPRVSRRLIRGANSAA